MNKQLLTIAVLVFTFTFSYSQSGRVGIGTSNPEQKLDVAGSAKANDKVIGTRGFVAGSVTADTAKAVFTTDITNKGFYIPRLTTAQKNSLGLTLNATNKGLLVFDTDINRTDFWDGTAWKAVGDGAGGPPTGSAGGDLTGTYPNPTIANDAVTSNKILNGTITSSDLATPAVNAANQIFNTLPVGNGGTGVNTITGAVIGNGSSPMSGVAASSGNQVLRRNNANTAYEFAQVQYSDVAGTPSTLPPSGAAGGDLTGTYPSPTVGAGKIDNGKLANDAVSTTKIANNAVTIAKLPSGATNTTFLRGDGTWVTPTDNNTTYTASNGLNISSNDIRLGGTLNTNTDVALNSKKLTFSGIGYVGIGTALPNNTLTIQRVSGASSTADIISGDGTQWTQYNTNSSGGSWNPMVQNNDHTIIYSNGSQNTGGFTLGQWSNQNNGIRIDPNGNVGIGTGTPAGKLQVKGSSMVYSSKTDAVEPDYAAGDQTVLLGLYTAGSSVKFEFYATGGWAEKGAEFNIAGEWSTPPLITVISDPTSIIGGRLKLYFKPNGSTYGQFWLAATWENYSPGKSTANALRFRITSAADFYTSNTTPFSGYTLINRSVENGPIGSIMAWHKNLPGVPSLPSNWVECNGQTLSDIASPLNGQVIPNLNGNNYFLRGNTVSGSIGGAASHTHGINIQQVGWDAAPDASHYTDGTIISTAAASNLPPYMDIVWIMRIK